MIYLFGGELFRCELLDDEAWKAEAADQYDLNEDVAAAIIQIARRRQTPRQIIMLTGEESALVLPPDSEHRAEAIEQLTRSDVFKIG